MVVDFSETTGVQQLDLRSEEEDQQVISCFIYVITCVLT